LGQVPHGLGTPFVWSATDFGMLTPFGIQNTSSGPSAVSAIVADLADINGDGLPDMLTKHPDGLGAYLNNGSGFSANRLNLGLDAPAERTVTGVADGSIPPSFIIPTEQYMTRRLIDVDGDNFLDSVNIDGGTLTVSFNVGDRFLAPRPLPVMA